MLPSRAIGSLCRDMYRPLYSNTMRLREQHMYRRLHMAGIACSHPHMYAGQNLAHIDIQQRHVRSAADACAISAILQQTYVTSWRSARIAADLYC